MTLPENVDIAIVGGGMVGLSQALLLAHQMPKAKLALLESFSLEDSAVQLGQPSFDDRSTALSPATTELLSLLGHWGRISQRAEPIRRVHVSDRGHLGSTSYSQAENEHRFLGYVVENRWFGRHLAAAVLASPVQVAAPAQVTDLTICPGGARLVYQQQGETRQLFASLVIIADGAESPLREKLGIGIDTHAYGQSAVTANLEFSRPHQGQAFERFTEQGPLAILPLTTAADNPGADSSRAALVWTRPDDQLAETLAWDDDTFIAALQADFGYRLGSITRVGTRHSYPLKMIFAREQVRSSVALIGNAAHYLHPVAGQGFNLALRDCAQLAAVLGQAWLEGRNPGSLPVLNEYLALQSRDQGATAMLSHSFVRVFSNRNFVMQAGRNLGLIAMELSDLARREFFAQMMGQSLPRARLAGDTL